MGHSYRLTRGPLPLLAALAAVPALAWSASAQVAPAASGASPGHAVTAAISSASGWWLTALNARQAWADAPEKGDGVTVAVLSTGTEGTPLASLISGSKSGTGGAPQVAGIAPKARILPVRVASGGQNPLPDAIARAIGHAASQGADRKSVV